MSWVTRLNYGLEQQYYRLQIELENVKQGRDNDSIAEQQRLLSVIQAQEKARKSAGKTDDLGFVVMKPFHQLAVPALDSERVMVPVLIKTGYMTKAPRSLQCLQKINLKLWQRRFFSLSASTCNTIMKISYHTDEQACKDGKIPRATLDLSSTLSVERIQVPSWLKVLNSVETVIQVKTTKGSFFFSPCTEEEFVDWLKHFKLNLSHVQKS